MKRILPLLLALALLALVPMSALADNLYLMPDSHTRDLTLEELREWDYESLNFIYNEIFARYGFVFKEGGKFDNWFRSFPWYIPNENPNNQTQVYPKVKDVEWRNYQRIKEVMAEKKANGDKSHDPSLKCYTQFTPPGNWSITGFSLVQMNANQTIPVYTAPGYHSYRANNGKAAVNTNGAVWAAGWENGWLAVYYETNDGAIRVGYINGSDIQGKVRWVGNDQVVSNNLVYAESIAATVSATAMTDDPMKANITFTIIPEKTVVTYLTTRINQNGEAWDYIETTVDGKIARGFVRHGTIDIAEEEAEDIPDGVG